MMWFIFTQLKWLQITLNLLDRLYSFFFYSVDTFYVKYMYINILYNNSQYVYSLIK